MLFLPRQKASCYQYNSWSPEERVSGERFEAREWLDQRALDIIQCDCNVAGLTENWHISRMVHLRGILNIRRIWQGGGTTMAKAHFVAGIPNGEYCELNQTFHPHKEEIFKEPLTVEKGIMRLPERPGFGMELVDGGEKKFPFVPGRVQQAESARGAGMTSSEYDPGGSRTSSMGII